MVRPWSARPASGSSVSEQVKAEQSEERRGREKREFSAVVVSFNSLISVRPLEAFSYQIVLLGRCPAHVFWGIPQ